MEKLERKGLGIESPEAFAELDAEYAKFNAALEALQEKAAALGFSTDMISSPSQVEKGLGEIRTALMDYESEHPEVLPEATK